MRKSTFTILIVVIMGLCAALPASAQVEGYAGGNEANLALLILINRLELTTGQMQQIHDILVGILDEASAISGKREAFAQEMLRFDGSAEKLDARLETFRTQIEGNLSALRENTQNAVDELTTILTVKQGDILRSSLRGLVARRLSEPSREGNVARQRMIIRIAPQGEGIHLQELRELYKRFGYREEKVGTREFIGMRGQIQQQLMGDSLQMNERLLQRIVDILQSKLSLNHST
ncbi:MAG: hypothetical protein V3S76_00475 [Candidatus Bipolaricaulota bacterium]